MRGRIFPFETLSVTETVLYYWFPHWVLGLVKRALRRWSGLRRHEVEVDGQRWVYLAGGRGEPLVFVHGYGIDKDSFWTFLSGLHRSYRVIVPDLPGFGEAEKSLSRRYDIPAQVKQLRAFLEALGMDACHLFGISLGGYISAYYASEYPEKVKSLGLMDAAGVSSKTQSEALRRYEEDGDIVLLYRNVEEFEELVWYLFQNPPWMPGQFKHYYGLRGALDYEIHSKVIRDILDGGIYALDSRLSKISARTLIMWGADDRLIDVSCVDTFLKGIPDSQAVIIDDCGHIPYLEKPKEAKRAYRKFLQAYSKSPSP